MKCSECERVEHVPSCSSANVSPSAERILQDLIAQLRGLNRAPYEQRSSVELAYRREAIEDLLDLASARLREVNRP